MQDRRVASTQTSLDLGRKVTCYLSAEFLMGPQLGNNLLNLQMERAAKTALAAMGQDLDVVLACEEEPGLGNGGLGRLAACLLSRFGGDVAVSFRWLLRPLRIWDLSTGNSRRLADRDHGQVAALWQSLGDRQTRGRLPRQLGRSYRMV